MTTTENTFNNQTKTLGARYDACFFGRLVPRYALFSLPLCLGLDSGLYWLAKLIQQLFGLRFYDLSLPLDHAVPFSVCWIWVYVGCFVFWAFEFLLVARQGRRAWFRFFTANTMGLLICFFFFLVLPTRIDRPEPLGPGISRWAARVVFSADTPVNLFPSIHCMGAWIGYCGIRGHKELPLWIRLFVPLFSLLVCASTMLVKQHFFVDTFSGILLAEAMWLLNRRLDLSAPAERLFGALDRLVFGR